MLTRARQVLITQKEEWNIAERAAEISGVSAIPFAIGTETGFGQTGDGSFIHLVLLNIFAA